MFDFLEGKDTYKREKRLYNRGVDGIRRRFSRRYDGTKHRAEKGDTVRNYEREKYTAALADEMTAFFDSYEDRGAPSFEKFARLKGIPLDTLVGFRTHHKFDRAYRECSEIRRDYLIDRALDKRFDPTFVRHLLTEEAEEEPSFTQTSLTLEIV